MTPSFDLATRGFCRVRWRPGRAPQVGADDPVSLRGLLVHAADIADVQVPHPPALAGLLRVLYVLAARITGLDRIGDAGQWEDRREELLDSGDGFEAAAVEDYFARYPGRFELFHTATDRPFLQDKRLLEECRNTKGQASSSGVNKLVLGRAAGQSLVWLSHTNDAQPVALPAEEAVFSLLTWLYYGAPGRCTPRQVGKVNEASTKAGPLRGTVSYHPLGESLFETLLLGMPYRPSDGDDRAPWEDELCDPLGPPPEATGIARVLTGRFQHALLLSPSQDGAFVEDARITWAWRHPHGPVKDPFLIYRTAKDSGLPFPESAEATRAVWRDLDGLLAEDTTRERPDAFRQLDVIMLDRRRPVRLTALGFEQDRSQAKDRQFYAATTPALQKQWRAAYSGGELWHRLRRALTAAETSGKQLQVALSSVWRELSKTARAARVRDEGVPWLHTGMTGYWSAAEAQFWHIVQAETPPAGSLSNRFIRCALDAYDKVTRNLNRTGPAVKVVEKHRRGLWRGWEKQTEGDHGA
ncbi:type I-E CRISPR-associated protein Cse1/CasA [Saccharopolyspora thermophila]|uniref:CRISPR-associated protein, Cse1 family n=1 Tax=Saccharopolyspora thermophila TaxID=89367 RepID=A0ABN1CQ84_9PSEU